MARKQNLQNEPPNAIFIPDNPEASRIMNVFDLPIQFDDGLILENINYMNTNDSILDENSFSNFQGRRLETTECSNADEFVNLEIITLAQNYDENRTTDIVSEVNEADTENEAVEDNRENGGPLEQEDNMMEAASDEEDLTEAGDADEELKENFQEDNERNRKRSASTAADGEDEEDAQPVEPDDTTDVTEAELSEEIDDNLLGENERKRKKRIDVDRSQWKRNFNKNKRMKGEAYLGFTRNKDKVWKNNRQREARTMGERCSGEHSKIYECRKVTEECRNRLFSNFWSFMTWEQKKIYIVNHVGKSVPKRRRSENEETQKSMTFKYYLKNYEDNVRVCKQMFLNTFGLKEWSVRAWCQNSISGTLPSKEDTKKRRTADREARGCTLKHKKRREFLESWLDRLPRLPSHYARHDTKKLYIEDHFIKSKSQLYKLYKDDCKESQPLSSFIFDEMFDKKDLAIFQPKKDQCDLCCAFKAGNFTTITEEDYECHIANKDRTRLEKQADKEYSISGDCNMVTMDLQAVQLCPRLHASKLYFKMKLKVHNFTIYNVATHQSTNFWWHEGEGEVSSSNFTSCIIDYLNTHFKESDKPIILYSDGCGYQNRCSVFANALLTFAVKENKVITQKYLCKGHTQMECDSVYSLIERRLKTRDINLPGEYISVTKRAREKPFPLDAKYLTHDFFLNYAHPEFQWYNSIRPGTSLVNDIKCLKYTPEGEILYKLDLDSDFKPLRRNKNITNKPIIYPKLYHSKPKISLDKYNHLMEITGVMDPEYTHFYKNLPHENKKKN